MNHIYEYANLIERGTIVVNARVKQQVTRLVAMLDKPTEIDVPLMDGGTERREFFFSEAHANRPIDFIEIFCKQSKGRWAGSPINLQLFQKMRYQAIFGFVDSETGLRLCNEVHVYEGRKNGKSTENSGTGLFMQAGDGEGGPQVVCLATKKDQARIVHNEAKNMVAQSPELRKIIKRRKSDLYSEFNFGTFEPMASDSDTLDGLNPNCAIIDELHALKDRGLYDIVKQAMYAREQPLLSIITTAGYVRESIYDEMYEEDTNILDGLDGFVNPRILIFMYELDRVDEWTDYKTWEKANPGLGTIKSFETLAENVEKAKRSKAFLPTLLAKDFNMRQTVNKSWLTFDTINNTETFDIKDLRESYAIGGVDLSATTDLTCATLLVEKGEKLFVMQMYFIPEAIIEQRVREDHVPYDQWAEQGLVTLCQGSRVNFSDVTAWFIKMRDEYKIYPYWIGFDPWGSQYWVEEMKQNAFMLEQVRQGAQTMSQPMKEMESDFIEKRFNYNNNPMLKWNLTNTQVKSDENGNIRPVKGKSTKQRIDGAVSLIDAYVVYTKHREDYRNLQGG